jgi:CheY-like chemotaxis protein
MAPRSILLVDDNEVNRAVAAGLLERRGHRVVMAEDGPSAIIAAAPGGFDLVLLDMRMPGMDGVETALAIRALPGPPGQVPIFLLTANPLPGDEPRWRQAGIRGCLTKPFRIDDISRVLAGDAGEPAEEARTPPLVALPDLMVDLRDLGRERMVGLVELFRRSSGADLDRLLAQAGEGRIAEAGGTAHRMAGAASSLHLRPLSERCREIDSAARRQDSAGLVAQVEALSPLWHRSLDALVQALDLPRT